MNCKAILLFSLLFCGSYFASQGQGFCPTNIDFELGTTADWNYFRGTVSGTLTVGPTYALTSSAATTGWHTLTSGILTDHFGGFPVVAPGGGSYSLKLGHDTTNSVAERALYYVHIPAGTTDYSLVYHYAAVLENPTPVHPVTEQPRLVVDAYDSATGVTVSCISYTYVASATLPGFVHSTVTSTIAGNGTDVYYKPWTTGNMKFPGYNGRTVAIEFTANACTPGGHFGYGYIDMSCGLFAITTVTCGVSTATVSAPPGYSTYHWYDSTTFSTSYGTGVTATITVPLVATTYAVICTPYTGYGCPDTLYTRLLPTSLVTAPSHDTTVCAGTSVSLSSNATDISLPLTYSWAPSAGLSCTACATTVATPTVTTAYSVTTTDAGGCLHTDVINMTVYPNPTAITGPPTACVNATMTLSDATTGGGWTSSSTATATIGSVSGVVGGVAPGTVTITYSFGSGLCATTTVVTVNPQPPAITGTTVTCVGATTTLSDAAGAGTWSSSTSTATVSPAGIVSGIGPGNSTITYTAPTGCTRTILVTINPLPPAITGVTTVCAGATTSLSDAGGGTWSSGNTSVATVITGTGLVGGVATGTAVITYTAPINTCTTTTTVNVTTAPLPVSGTLHVCIGATTPLGDATPGGTWASSNGVVATISGTGVVSGVNPGTTTIAYTAPGGCQAFAVVTVNTFAGVIVGASGVCAGSATTLADAGGGTWSSSDMSVATVDPGTGTVTGAGIAGGTVTITYTLPDGCTATDVMNVFPLPSVITGTAGVCTGAVTTLNDITPGGTWISGNTAIATADIFAGTVSGVSAGTATISYVLPTTCMVTTTVTVNPLPFTITGSATVCTGAATTLSDIGGGTWSSSDPATASVDSISGAVTGGALTVPGSATITYTLPTGCSITSTMVVYPLPPAITGTFGICVGQSTFLRDGGSSGTWTASNSNATMNPTFGILTGVSPGTDTITYTLAGTGCSANVTVTVNSSPGIIIGTAVVCAGSTTSLTDGGGGTWTSGNVSVATAGLSTGTISGLVAGTSLITYSLGGTCVSTITVTVNALPPLATVSGGGSFCAGGTGVHISCAPSGAGISYQLYTAGTPVGSAIAGTGTPIDFGLQTLPGIYTVVATNSVTGCSRTMTGSATVAVNPLPTVYTVTGGGSYCTGGAGAHIGLNNSDAGIHYQLIPSGITITGTGSPLDFGSITGGGTYTVVATNPVTGCTDVMAGSTSITISAPPTPYPVTGGGAYCAGGAGFPILTGGSSAGVSYQLFLGATPTGAPMPGSGGGLNFGVHTVAGTYTVLATGTATTCSGPMTGSAVITINPSPAIVGPTAVCVGASIGEIAPGFSGGTWSSASPSVATVGSLSGIVSGVLTGSTSTITYTSGAGCTATAIVTVSSSPVVITGRLSVCMGSAVTDSDAVPGGTWASSSAGIATVGSLSGIVSGITTGPVTITYSLGSGCTVTRAMTVTPAPAVVTGITSLCIAASAALSDATPGGTWSSGNNAVATVVAGTGAVWGVSAGTAGITYTLGGCTSATIVTVNATPAIISGPATACAGTAITETDAIVSGTWTSSNPAAATIDPSAGTIICIAPGGVTTITYSLGGSCVVTRPLTVNPISAISGATGLCVGATTTLAEATTGGTWTSNPVSIATVAGGITGGAAAGVATITYTTAAGCTAYSTVTVNTSPSPIAGITHVCMGASTLLSDAAGGGTWSSSAPATATAELATGVVWGVNPGTATITYSLGFGCTRFVIVTVNPLPLVAAGPAHVCIGTTITLTDGTPGGTWGSNPAAIATVVPGTGVVTGVLPGSDTVTYTITSTGCTATEIITVNPLPSPVIGAGSICVGSSATLSDVSAGGTWASSNPAVVTIGAISGNVLGIGPGTATITYSIGSGCTITTTETVIPSPPAITGASMVCTGSSTIMHDAAGGGIWATGPAAIATIDPVSGSLSGISSGTVIVSYTVGSGCRVISSIIINQVSPVTGPGTVCAGQSITLSDTTGDGTWSSSNTAAVTAVTTGVNTGLITGASATAGSGVTIITYTLPTGCTAAKVVSVNPVPLPISGVRTVCVGSTTTLSDATPGVTWGSMNSLIATVSGGVVSGVEAGVVNIITSMPGTGCPAFASVTVNPLPAAISAPGAVCTGATVTLTDAVTGGAWECTSLSVATINIATGVLAGIIPGTATITYTLPTGCSVSATVNVDALPSPVTGNLVVCQGAITPLADVTGGGTWSSSNILHATVDPAGNVTGTGAGTAIISYNTGAGCSAIAVVTVNSIPGGISGTLAICQGTATTLTDAPAGGTWTSSDLTVAVIDTFTGHVTGAGPGSSIITYTTAAGCSVSNIMFVSPAPAAVSGAAAICLGLTTSLADATGGGAWTSSATAIATVDPATGIVTGNAAGTATISYALPGGGCAATVTVTVNPFPSAIAGTATVCMGAATTLSDPVTGGTWSSSDITIASVNVFTGAVTGGAPGTADITYSLGSGCSIPVTVTVNPLPLVTGVAQVCAGSAIVLSAVGGSGAWSSSNTFVATVAPAAGVVTGVLPGTAVAAYTLATGCAAGITVTVNPMPSPIGGSPIVCLNATHELSDAVPGGVWSSSTPAVATVDAATGVVSGLTLGAANICYTLSGGCRVCTEITVYPLPVMFNITGGGSYCDGGAGVHIDLSGSSVGVNYLLYHGVTATGTFAGTGVALDFGLQTVAGAYTVIGTSAATGCSNIMTGSAAITITPTVTPAVSIAATAGDTVCSGTSVTFSPLPVYGGSTPSYLWRVNGVAVGTGTDYTFVPAGGDVVSVTMASTGTCPAPATATGAVTMTVLTAELPVANMAAIPGDTVCQGTAVTLASLPLYGGTAPVFTWIKNGVNAGTGRSYTYIPSNGDVVYYQMHSNYICPLADTVSSHMTVLTVDTPMLPLVTINASAGTSFAIGAIDTLTASVANGGAAPTYQWMLNSMPVAGATTNTYLSKDFNFPDEDSVTCVVTSNGICSMTSFAWIYISLHPAGVKTITPAAGDISVQPNPNKGIFIIKGSLGGVTDEEVSLEITDMLGQVVYKDQVTAHNGKIDQQVSLGNTLANGMYMLNVRSGTESKVFHIVIEQ